MRIRVKALVFAAIALTSVAAAGVYADLRLTHGLNATWTYKRDGRWVVVAETVEHRASFPNANRPLARYVQHWSYRRWGVPSTPPPLDARLEGSFVVPPGKPRSLLVESSNQVRLDVDGRAYSASMLLSPGEHTLGAHWSGAFGQGTNLRFILQATDGSTRSLSSSSFRPLRPVPSSTRIAVWVGTAVLALLFAWLAFRSVALESGRRRWRATEALLLVSIVMLALGLRLFDYAVMPEFRENADELFATWNGYQLLRDGTTRGWSLWPGLYGNEVTVEPLTYFGTELFVIRPYFEHPPLLHLLVGAAAKLGGATQFSHARLLHTRLVPIALSMLALFLMVRVGRRLDPGRVSPYLGAILFAAIPFIALQSRAIKEEALVTPLALASVLFFLRWQDEGNRKRDLIVSAVLAGLCTLAKVPGLVFVVALTALVLAERRYRAAALAFGVGIATASLLLVYAAAIDWDVFWMATRIQATGRGIHFNIFTRFFADPLINHNLVGRGWLVFLWIAWAAALARMPRRSRAPLVLAPLVYLVAIAVPSGDWTYGWYLLPVYPFLCLGAGRFLQDLWESPDLLRGFVFVVLLVMYGLNFLTTPEVAMSPAHTALARQQVTVFVLLGLGPFGLATIDPARFLPVGRVAVALGLAVFLGTSGYFVVNYDRIAETHKNFDRMGFFNLAR